MSEYIRDYDELYIPFFIMPHVFNPMVAIVPEMFSGTRRCIQVEHRWLLVDMPSQRFEGNSWDIGSYPLVTGQPFSFGKYKRRQYHEVVERDEAYAVDILSHELMSEDDKRYLGWLIWMKRAQGKCR